MSYITNTKNGKSVYGWYFWVALLLALILLGLWLMGYGPWGKYCKENPLDKTAQIVTPAIVVPSTVAPEKTLAVRPMKIESPLPAGATLPVPEAHVYFNINKTDAPADTDEKLKNVIEYIKVNKDAKVQLTGFHDPSGSKERNVYLATQRAQTVQSRLITLGADINRLVIINPVETTGTGNPREARRVDIKIVEK